ncbi:Bifunctional polynucleotide phosphatase/kinase [Golovinomyces cichoracearum]|uniref:Bifunctional polynucleotide phosphatase/kinase n=1 Tax=Golovinomyces cichoracearum TaxID=62708 RepID=A0A420H226_9PEZI|nr:Bifunctional polynucleotide phosphatase/kinase [Golovinomyces cichoracearum]
MLRCVVCGIKQRGYYNKMSASLATVKRKRISDGSKSATSPRRKQSKATLSSSEKSPEKIEWHARGKTSSTPNTLLVGRYVPPDDSRDLDTSSTKIIKTKIAAFDFDSTIIRTKHGKVFPTHAQDWKWWHPSVPAKLQKLHLEDDFLVAIISNQAGLSLKTDSDPKSKLSQFKRKVSDIFKQLNIPLIIYAATEKDFYRKPRTGIWTELLRDYGLEDSVERLSLEDSIFVGDAAGRQAYQNNLKDFSCCDRNFAENVGIRFATPEEYFLGEKARPFVYPFRPSDYIQESKSHNISPNQKDLLSDTSLAPQIYIKKNEVDIVLLCGSPGAGKSCWYLKNLKCLGYIRINQDTLKTRDKCIKVASKNLEEGKSVAIDNTNANTEVRSEWVRLAARYKIPIRCVYLTTSAEICVHNDAVRAFNDVMNPENRKILPNVAFNGYRKKFQCPELNEGFQDITEIPFQVLILFSVAQFVGTAAEQKIWSRHWV